MVANGSVSRPSRPYSALRRAAAGAVAILEEDGYSTDADLAAELRLSQAELRTVVSVLYRQRRVDRVAGYVVLPRRREG